MHKVQITFTPQEYAALADNVLGYTVPKYLKFLAGSAALPKIEGVPTFKASKSLEKISAKALKDYMKGKLKSFNSVEEMFADL